LRNQPWKKATMKHLLEFCVVCPEKMQKGRREGRREVGMTTVSRCERGAKEVE